MGFSWLSNWINYFDEKMFSLNLHDEKIIFLYLYFSIHQIILSWKPTVDIIINMRTVRNKSSQEIEKIMIILVVINGDRTSMNRIYLILHLQFIDNSFTVINWLVNWHHLNLWKSQIYGILDTVAVLGKFLPDDS